MAFFSLESDKWYDITVRSLDIISVHRPIYRGSKRAHDKVVLKLELGNGTGKLIEFSSKAPTATIGEMRVPQSTRFVRVSTNPITDDLGSWTVVVFVRDPKSIVPRLPENVVTQVPRIIPESDVLEKRSAEERTSKITEWSANRARQMSLALRSVKSLEIETKKYCDSLRAEAEAANRAALAEKERIFREGCPVPKSKWMGYAPAAALVTVILVLFFLTQK